ncbi:phosphoglycerate kinase, cytosolic, partial [Tanacetum coccineum]
SFKEGEKNDPEFSKKLVSLADLYVNDAFGTAHRAHASTEGVAKYLKPSVTGYLTQKELHHICNELIYSEDKHPCGSKVSSPNKPFAAIVGGSKVSSKIGVIESLLEKVNILVLGGGMILNFYKAQGYKVGSSLVEEDKFGLATSLLKKAKSKGVSLLLPSDVVIAHKFAADANSKYELILSHVTLPDNLDWFIRAPTPVEEPFRWQSRYLRLWPVQQHSRPKTHNFGRPQVTKHGPDPALVKVKLPWSVRRWALYQVSCLEHDERNVNGNYRRCRERIIAAETLKTSTAQDASRNKLLQDVGL